MTTRKPVELWEGIWRFCSIEGEVTKATGYCGERECKHTSAEEACDCFREYVLKNTYTKMNGRTQHTCDGMVIIVEDEKKKIKRCNGDARYMVNMDGSYSYYLCDKHATRDEVRKLMDWGKKIKIISQ